MKRPLRLREAGTRTNPGSVNGATWRSACFTVCPEPDRVARLSGVGCRPKVNRRGAGLITPECCRSRDLHSLSVSAENGSGFMSPYFIHLVIYLLRTFVANTNLILLNKVLKNNITSGHSVQQLLLSAGCLLRSDSDKRLRKVLQYTSQYRNSLISWL